jgi:hypothetical protein
MNNLITYMKKLLFAIAILTGLVVVAHAQTNYDTHPRVSAGFIYGGALGAAADNYTYASGFLVKYELPVKSIPLSLTLTSGYSFFIPQTRFYSYINPGNGGGMHVSYSAAAFIPLEIGARVYVANKLYFEGNIGASLNVNSPHEYYTAKTVALLLSPNLGYSFRFGSSGKAGLDLSLGYENRFESASLNYYQGNYGRLALSAAFSLGL